MDDAYGTEDMPDVETAAAPGTRSEALVEVRAVVRIGLLDSVVHCLKAAGVPRLAVERVHAIGSGVDPDSTRISFEEGSEYAEMARVRLICRSERCAMVAELIANAARTGRNGDGIVSMHPVIDVLKIRTGARGTAALS